MCSVPTRCAGSVCNFFKRLLHFFLRCAAERERGGELTGNLSGDQEGFSESVSQPAKSRSARASAGRFPKPAQSFAKHAADQARNTTTREKRKIQIHAIGDVRRREWRKTRGMGYSRETCREGGSGRHRNASLSTSVRMRRPPLNIKIGAYQARANIHFSYVKD